MTQDKAPDHKRIWLQPFAGDCGGHTWCQDRIEDDDIEYIRLDEHERALSQAYERGQVDMRERAPTKWESLRKVIICLKENGKDDEYGVDEDTADTAKSIVDLLEIANAEPPTIWWHGGDAIVLNFDALGHMMTVSGDSVHVHYPAIRSLPIDSAGKDGS